MMGASTSALYVTALQRQWPVRTIVAVLEWFVWRVWWYGVSFV